MPDPQASNAASPAAAPRISASEMSVPDELINELHEANKLLHEAKKRLEASMEATDYQHEEHVGREMDKLREVESQQEELDRKIQASPSIDAKPGDDHAEDLP